MLIQFFAISTDFLALIQYLIIGESSQGTAFFAGASCKYKFPRASIAESRVSALGAAWRACLALFVGFVIEIPFVTHNKGVIYDCVGVVTGIIGRREAFSARQLTTLTGIAIC